MLMTQVELDFLNDNTKFSYLQQLKDGGFDLVLVSCEDFFYPEAKRAAMLQRLRDAILFFRENEFTVGVWVSTLGYGTPRNDYFNQRFPDAMKLVDVTGAVCTAICTTDQAFLEATCENVKDYLRAGTDLLLFDDDLVQSVRPGLGCTCPNHMKMLREKVGRDVTREEIIRSFTGEPNDLRKDFLGVMGDSFWNFCRALREAADEVNPQANLGICTSYTHYDCEGVDYFALCEMLAGPNTPFVRISGAPYWNVFAPRYPGQDLGGVEEFVRMQFAWLKAKNYVVSDENDPFPRDSKVVSADLVEAYDDVTAAEGGVIRHKYLLCAVGNSPADPAYLTRHVERREEQAAVANIFENTISVGFSVIHPPRFLAESTLPGEFAGPFRLMSLLSHPMGGIFLSLLGIPTAYGTAGPCVAFGNEILGLTREQFLQGVLTDLSGRELLEKKGIRLKNTETDGGCGGFCTFGETEDGLKLGVLNTSVWDADFSRRILPDQTVNPENQKKLAALYRFFSGEDLPARIDGSHGIYLIAGKKSDRSGLSVLLVNAKNTPAENVAVVLSQADRLTLSKTMGGACRLSGERLIFENIPAYGTAAALLT